GINISGVDFWHAVEFSRNGRFLRTHPLGLSSGRFPSMFPTLSDLADPISSVPFRVPLARFPFRRTRLYQKFWAVLTGLVPMRREKLLRNLDFKKRSRCSRSPVGFEPMSRQLFESTSPRCPCQRVPWGEEDTSSSAVWFA